MILIRREEPRDISLIRRIHETTFGQKTEELGIKCWFEARPEVFMVTELTLATLENTKGPVRYQPEFKETGKHHQNHPFISSQNPLPVFNLSQHILRLYLSF